MKTNNGIEQGNNVRVVNLSTITTLHRGQGLTKTDITVNGTHRCILYGELYTTYNQVINNVKSSTNILGNVLSVTGDVLIPGSTTADAMGIATASVLMLDNVVIGGDINLLRPNQKLVNPIYLTYLLSFPLKRKIASLAKGTTIIHLLGKDIISLDVPLPSLPEQGKIADCLTSLDDLIQAQTQKLEAYKSHKSALLQQLFPQDDALTPPLRFPEFIDQSSWVLRKMGDYFDFQMCKRIFSEQTNSIEGVPFYKIGTIGSIPDSFIDRKLFLEYKRKYNYPIKGEILITCSGTVGKCVVFDGNESYFQDSNIVWFRNKDKQISNEFLFQIVSNVDWGRLNSTTITRIYTSDLKDLEFCFPSYYQEQQKIADCLTSLDDLIQAQTEKIDLLKQHKAALIQNLFPKV